MRIDLGETETDAYVKARRSTNKLLVALHCHHDARMTVPEGWVKPEKKEPSPEFKELWFGPPVPTSEATAPLIEDIKRTVCKYYGVTLADLLSPKQQDKIVKPRQVVMYLAKSLTARSFPEIGRRLGGRDHSTIVHGVRKMAALVKSDWQIAYDVAHVEAML